jgi:hypothetical protein
MFDWSKEGVKVIIKLPFWIYFGATSFLVGFFLFILFIIHKTMKTERSNKAAKHSGKTNQNDNTAESDTTNDGRGSSVATGLDTGTNGSMDTKSRVRSTLSVNKAWPSVNGDEIV